ncbi:hypothetical protein SMICM17S_00683 [Streptomyces microflavus]
MASGQEVPLQPALAEVFGEHLHHPAVAGEVFVGGQGLCLPGLAGRPVEGLQPVGRRLVGADHPEVPALGRRGHDALQETAEHLGGRVGGGARLVDAYGVVLQGRDRQVAQEQTAVGVRGRAEPRLALGDTGEHLIGGAAVRVEELLGTVGAQPGLQLPQVLRVVPDPGERDLVERQVPSTGSPSTSFGPVQPLGVRSTIMGERGRSVAPSSRAARWNAAIRSTAVSIAATIARWTVAGSSPVTYSGSWP